MSKIHSLKTNERPKRKGVFYSKHVKNQNGNKVPDYYSSMAGNPYVGRLDKGVNTGTGLLKIETIIEDVVETDTGGGFGKTYVHGTGKQPYIIGSFQVVSVGSGGDESLTGLRGLIPEQINSGRGNRITELSNNTFTFGFSLPSMGAGTLKLKFYLLRETVSGEI